MHNEITRMHVQIHGCANGYDPLPQNTQKHWKRYKKRFLLATPWFIDICDFIFENRILTWPVWFCQYISQDNRESGETPRYAKLGGKDEHNQMIFSHLKEMKCGCRGKQANFEVEIIKQITKTTKLFVFTNRFALRKI